MVGIFVCLCLASQKPSEQEFFVPARTDLGVELLTKMLWNFIFSDIIWLRGGNRLRGRKFSKK